MYHHVVPVFECIYDYSENNMRQNAPYGSFFLGLTISPDLLVQSLQFNVRCVTLILRNVLHTHNMYFRPMENFLEVSEVQKI